MATLEEVIEDLGDLSKSEYLLDDIQYIIDENLRTIAIPDDGVVLGVVGDKNVNRVNFQMPRYYNGFDMSLFKYRITLSSYSVATRYPVSPSLWALSSNSSC